MYSVAFFSFTYFLSMVKRQDSKNNAQTALLPTMCRSRLEVSRIPPRPIEDYPLPSQTHFTEKTARVDPPVSTIARTHSDYLASPASVLSTMTERSCAQLLPISNRRTVASTGGCRYVQSLRKDTRHTNTVGKQSHEVMKVSSSIVLNYEACQLSALPSRKCNHMSLRHSRCIVPLERCSYYSTVVYQDSQLRCERRNASIIVEHIRLLAVDANSVSIDLSTTSEALS
ncbi:hypothetical protein Tco_1563437 [Tanacetum coccineum]